MTPANDEAAARAARDRELFDRIAEKYAAKDLHPAGSPARRQRLLQTLALAGPTDDLHLLEVGCGTGYSVPYLQGAFAEFTGLDYSAELIAIAEKQFAAENVHFIAADFLTYNPAQQFDLIFMIGVLHHMVEMPRMVQRCFDLLKPGGILVMNEPQPDNPLITKLRQMREKMDDGFSEEQEPLRGGQMTALMTEAGFTDTQTRAQGIVSTPFAEVPMNPGWLTRPLSLTACGVDRLLEKHAQPVIRHLTWNVIVSGRKPA